MKMIVATNVTDLRAEPSWHTELRTQVLNGTTLEILEESGSWCKVKQIDGYTGWAYRPYLVEYAETSPTHWVFSPQVALVESPAIDAAARTVLLFGTAATVTDVRGEWAKIQPAGGVLPAGWTHQSGLRPMRTLPAADARTQIIADAKRLTGVYYIWGGTSPFGLDCSALVQLTHRLSGYTLPRDAYLQFAAAKKVDAPYQPGDLLFFHGDADKDRITHVGISLGGWEMIHSSRNRNGVYTEDVQANENLKRTFVGAGIFVDRE
jgi:cell wall-associated NlpC family hydrolase